MIFQPHKKNLKKPNIISLLFRLRFVPVLKKKNNPTNTIRHRESLHQGHQQDLIGSWT